MSSSPHASTAPAVQSTVIHRRAGEPRPLEWSFGAAATAGGGLRCRDPSPPPSFSSRSTSSSSAPASTAPASPATPPGALAATAVSGRLGVPRRLVTILEGESLVNDATALVADRFAVAAVVGGGFSAWSAGGRCVVVALVGVAVDDETLDRHLTARWVVE